MKIRTSEFSVSDFITGHFIPISIGILIRFCEFSFKINCIFLIPLDVKNQNLVRLNVLKRRLTRHHGGSGITLIRLNVLKRIWPTMIMRQIVFN